MMKKKNLKKIIRRGQKQYQNFLELYFDSNLSSHAGEMAFFLILSFFPFIMLVLALTKYAPIDIADLIRFVSEAIPPVFARMIVGWINEINQQHFSVLPITMITCVWLGSKAFIALMRGLNDVYDISSKGNFFLDRIASIFYTVIFAILLIATLVVLVFGNTLYFHLVNFFPFLSDTLLSVIHIRSVVGFCILFLYFTSVFAYVPTGKHRRILYQMPGAFLTSLSWIIFSYLYSYYIDHISNYSFFYGTMTTIAFLMAWLYACMYLLFFGGLLNHYLEEWFTDDTPQTEQPEK